MVEVSYSRSSFRKILSNSSINFFSRSPRRIVSYLKSLGNFRRLPFINCSRDYSRSLLGIFLRCVPDFPSGVLLAVSYILSMLCALKFLQEFLQSFFYYFIKKSFRMSSGRNYVWKNFFKDSSTNQFLQRFFQE